MRRIAGISDKLIFHLIGVVSCIVARPFDDESSLGFYGQNDFAVGSELRDLLSNANSPAEKNIDGKKRIKNSSGKSDEGGYYKTYGSDADGEKGYVKQTYSNGDHGYKTLDTFHKKAGDNYGFEKHTGFGKRRGGEKGASQDKNNDYKTEITEADDHEGAGTIVDTYYVANDGENAAYTEAKEDGDASGESASYTDGGDNENYTADDDVDAAHYSEGNSDSGNYENSDGYNQRYSNGGGDDGSYGSHGSYTADEGGDGFYGGEYF